MICLKRIFSRFKYINLIPKCAVYIIVYRLKAEKKKMINILKGFNKLSFLFFSWSKHRQYLHRLFSFSNNSVLYFGLFTQKSIFKIKMKIKIKMEIETLTKKK